VALSDIIVRRVCDEAGIDLDDHVSIIEHLAKRVRYLEAIASHAVAFSELHSSGFDDPAFKKMTAEDWKKSDLHWLALLRMVDRAKKEMPVVVSKPLVYRMSEMHFEGT
jgi:hypothetical protein